MKQIKISVITIFVLILCGCSGTKGLKSGELLYTGAKVIIENDSLSKDQKKTLAKEIENQIRPKPNGSFLGLRPKVWIYNAIGETPKESGFRYWLKKNLGEKPILLSDVDREFNSKLAQNISENTGYLNAKANNDTIRKNKTVKVEYTVNTRSQFTIDKIEYPQSDDELSQAIRNTVPNSFLVKGEAFNLNKIVAERNRIDNELKEKGFYYFDSNNIIVQVDSTAQNNKVSLYVKVKDETPETAKKAYTINKIIVYPNYDLQTNVSREFDQSYRENVRKSLKITKDSLYIVDRKNTFKDNIFEKAIYLKPNELYNRTNHNLSLNRLITFGPFKFVKNQFVNINPEDNKLNVIYYLTPEKFKSLRLEFLGKTNSASYVGGEVNFNWRHKNAFRGGELFTSALYTAVDYQLGGDSENSNIYRVGADFSIVFPSLVAPFEFKSSSGFVPKTRVKLGYEYQKRTDLYTLHNFNASFGYFWKESASKEHSLEVIDITYVSPEEVTPKYELEMQNNLALQRVVEKQLIFGPTYRYTYTNSLTPQKHTFFYNGMLDLSANLTGLISGASKDNQKTVFGVPFSQYVKTEHSLVYYLKLKEKSQLASRLSLGVAFPYGNSEYMPFSKQFFVGGVNSIRSFRARTLGPGSYDPRSQGSSFFHDQAGDIKLEFNLEYRANIYKFLNAAFFVDAGNVWLFKEDVTKPGGEFGKDFLDEIAVGAGFGLRFDFNIILLRTDVAFPLRVPYYDKNDRWNFNNIQFGDSQWRSNNLILNIAIGYPF